MTTPAPDAMTRNLAAQVEIPSVIPCDAPPAPGRREAQIVGWPLAPMAGRGLKTGREDVAPGRPTRRISAVRR